jgi:Arc/MetJ-type ribon-helix-helix transcriptional regulator
MAPARTTFRLPAELSDKLDALAERWTVSRSDVVRLAIEALDLMMDPALLADPSVLALLGSKADLAARIGDALASDPVAEAVP